MPFGKIECFELHSKQWSAYVRRIKQFMLLNEIKSDLRVATLITLVGEPTYNLMCDLCAPTNPEDKTFDELVKIVAEHLEPQRSVIAERHVLENLRDQFVSGLASDDMRSRLFAEKDIQYKKAVELALALEAAEKHAERSAMGGNGGASGRPGCVGAGSSAMAPHFGSSESGEGLHVVRKTRQGAQYEGPSSCWRCGKAHRADKCRFKQYNCNVCNRKGHLKVMCKMSSSDRIPPADGKHNFINDDENSDNELFNISVVAEGDKPYFVNVNIEDCMLQCEIDTGSKISAINDEYYRRLFSKYALYNDQISLSSYTSAPIESLGYIKVDARIDDNFQKNLKLYVIRNGSRPILGRNWMRLFNINQLSVHNIQASEDRTRAMIVEELIRDYPNVFTNELGKCKKEIRLQLTDKDPVFVRARPVPLALREAVERELVRMQNNGSIYPLEHSEYGTPIVPVIKPSGEIRICGDYKTTINPKLKRDYYPLPRIDELFAALSGGEEYTKIDLTTAYLQVPLHSESQVVTTISTHVGNFAFRRVPYGLSCIPEKFQKLMEETLRGIPNTVCFLDDICTTAKNRTEHIKNLRAVIDRLAQMGLTVKISKCKFLQKSVSYLGFVIDKQGLHPDVSKVEAIREAPRPCNVTQLKAFLGMLNYYGKFIDNLSTRIHPLYTLLKKDVSWRWNDQCERSFNEAKYCLSSDKVLTHYDPSRPLVLSVDSSSYGMGAVLSHRYEDGSERPISCTSRTLSDTEKKYSQLDKEALAILYGVQKHHQYLFGKYFVLKTDHKPLTYIFGPKGGIPQTAASRLQRWAVKLAAYDFKIEYVPSKSNCNADALSRLPLFNESPARAAGDDNHYLFLLNETLPVSYKDISLVTKKDPLLSRILGYIMFGWPDKCEREDEKPFYVRRTELYLDHGCILYKYRVVIPLKLQERVLNEIHTGHLGIVKMKSIARNYVYWPSVDKDIEMTGRVCQACINVRDAPPKSSLHPWEYPAAPWHRLHADFAQYNGKYYIVAIDAHSKWLEAEEIRSTSAYDTIKFFRNLFSKFGLPLQLVTDNGPPFQSNDFKEFCIKNNIRHSTTSPYRPQGNGAAENSVKWVKKSLKRAHYEGQDLSIGLSRFLFQYRNCEHATTGVAPAVALLGRRLRSRLDAMRPHTAGIVSDAQEKQRSAAGGSDRHYKVGDKIFTRDYSNRPDKWAEGYIVEKTGPVSYRISLDNGSSCRRHVDQMLPAKQNRFSLARRHSSTLIDNNCLETDLNNSSPKCVLEHTESVIVDEVGNSSPRGERSTPAGIANPHPHPPTPPPPPESATERTIRAYNRDISITLTIMAAWIADSAVLDPALYLAPSPPLMVVSDSIPPGEMWGRSLDERTRISRYVSENVKKDETTTQKPMAVESRMFWPSFSPPRPALGINIPLTFSLSGTYGKVSSVPAGVIGNTYTTVTGVGSSLTGLGTSMTGVGTSLGSTLSSTLGTSVFGKSAVGSAYGNYGRSALAGSSYGTYGTSAVRVFGSDNVAAWSGWGNGKWGHYGKG